ncbi:MAG: MFS transporter [Candidatus Izemoplasmataceae bacterium]|jgi:maltose/moltooligosaccharide transporter|uniref:MFS transporter n=1 Tax=Liberiplasma polymorphum TaxID=3374570 RepID=UPI00377257B7
MNNELKLNFKTTIYIGFAFFSILMLWQIYNVYGSYFLDLLLESRIPVRTDRSYIVGIIMALDNFFALFMLPIFGALSDRTKSRFGRRMPYIMFGMLASAILFPMIAVVFILNSLVGVIGMMLLILIIMNIYRNPAIALMPDVTPKPLRSKANGFINLIGYVGAILAGGLALIFGPGAGETINDISTFRLILPFIIVSGFMVVALIVLVVKIKENKLVEDVAEDMLIGETYSDTVGVISESEPLSKGDRFNMIILLISVFLWFAAFNAIETFISIYSEEVLNDFSFSGLIVIVLVMSSIVTFVPAGYLASYVGRKRSVVIGLGLMIFGLLISLSINAATAPFLIGIVFAGVGWAMINVNSYPMMVEMAHKNNVGRYTGYYYISSMLAQTFTPIVAGLVIMIGETYEMLFPYSGVLAACAFVVFIFFKEKKNGPREIKTGLDAFDVD